MTNNRIYTKQINMDGTASFKVYELRATPIETMTMPNMSNFVTREEFEQLKAALIPQTKPSDNNVAAQF